MGCGQWGWGGWMFGGLAVFLFWGLLVLVIVLAVRAAARSSTGGSATVAEDPLDILRRRYAAGQISREQFEQMRRDLQ